MEINTVKEGYYNIIEISSGLVLAQKNSEVEAIQGLVNYQLAGVPVIMQPPSYRVDITDPPDLLPIGEIIEGEGYTHLMSTIANYVRLFPDMDIIRVEGEIFQWQRKFILESIHNKDHITTYTSSVIPFQFIEKQEIIEYIDGAMKYRVTATEQCKILYYINNILDSASSSAFDASQVTPTEFRHTRILTANHGDKVEVVIENIKGDTDTFTFLIETVHQLDKSARIKVLNEEILTIMQEPNPN